MTELWIFIQQECIKLIKSDSKNIYNFTKIKINKSRDTKDWSNGCWKFSFGITGINYILKYINNIITNPKLLNSTVCVYMCMCEVLLAICFAVFHRIDCRMSYLLVITYKWTWIVMCDCLINVFCFVEKRWGSCAGQGWDSVHAQHKFWERGAGR